MNTAINVYNAAGELQPGLGSFSLIPESCHRHPGARAAKGVYMMESKKGTGRQKQSEGWCLMEGIVEAALVLVALVAVFFPRIIGIGARAVDEDYQFVHR